MRISYILDPYLTVIKLVVIGFIFGSAANLAMSLYNL